MTFDFYGQKGNNRQFNKFVDFISQAEHTGWKYCGMNVELDPTVDFNNQNILIRWLDVNEGFNDKIILSSIYDFQQQFQIN